MKQFRDRVAVVTGGASGIGLALARAFGAAGMRVVIADVEPDALAAAARELEALGVRTLAVATDVSRAQDVEALAARTLEAFGAVHVVCNNAGVFCGGTCWEASLEDYSWVLGVNLWGVIHGIRSFVPILLEQGEEGHIVNTASMAGLASLPFTPIYTLSKHAVLSLSESLYHELRLRGAKIGVSALCPELVATRIDRSARNRPGHLACAPGASSEVRELVEKSLREGVQGGVPPQRIAERVLQAIRDQRFYVLSEGDAWRRVCESRLEDVQLARNPTFVPPSD